MRQTIRAALGCVLAGTASLTAQPPMVRVVVGGGAPEAREGQGGPSEPAGLRDARPACAR